MEETNNYIISGGAEGKKRLNILSDVLYPYTKALLEKNGITNGMNFLDAGCGGGNVSVMAAQMVSNSGKVTAIDFDKQIISLNQQEAVQKGFTNLHYKAMSIYDVDFSDEFDMVYSRFLLSHLTEPQKALQKLKESLKPGGKIIVEDVHFSGHFCYPHNTAFQQYVEFYMQAAIKRGHNPEIGPELVSMFRDAGFEEIGFDVIQPAFATGDGKWMAYITMEKIKEAIINTGLADKNIIDNILSELESYTKDTTTIISLPRIFRVWGVKPN